MGQLYSTDRHVTVMLLQLTVAVLKG